MGYKLHPLFHLPLESSAHLILLFATLSLASFGVSPGFLLYLFILTVLC